MRCQRISANYFIKCKRKIKTIKPEKMAYQFVREPLKDEEADKVILYHFGGHFLHQAALIKLSYSSGMQKLIEE